MLNTKHMLLAQKALDFRTQRQDLLTSNIANKDTPGYSAQDMVFESALKSALNADVPGPMKITNSKHFDGNFTEPMSTVQGERITSAAPFVGFDGNSVDLDREMAKLAENQLMYNATVKMMSHKFKQLKTAITEGGA